MLGSAASVADPNIVLNTIVADAFATAADKLEKSENLEKDIKAYTEKLLKEHYRIIFNYNGYGPEWEQEAEHRGLLNAKTTADAVPELLKKKTWTYSCAAAYIRRAKRSPARISNWIRISKY